MKEEEDIDTKDDEEALEEIHIVKVSRLVRLPTVANGKFFIKWGSTCIGTLNHFPLSPLQTNIQSVNRRNASKIAPHDRPAWFVVLDLYEEEPSGPFSVNELCQQWHLGLIDGDTLVWSSDNAECNHWAPIDDIIHRPLKALLLRPYLPPVTKDLNVSSLNKIKKEAFLATLFHESLNHHIPKPLHLLTMSLSCSECGCVASISCSGCSNQDSSNVSSIYVPRYIRSLQFSSRVSSS